MMGKPMICAESVNTARVSDAELGTHQDEGRENGRDDTIGSRVLLRKWRPGQHQHGDG